MRREELCNLMWIRLFQREYNLKTIVDILVFIYPI